MSSTTKRSMKAGKGKPYKGKGKGNRSGFSSKQVSAIRKIAQTTQETKMASQTSTGLAVYHNGGVTNPYTPNLWLENLMATQQGVTDNKVTIRNRIGDSVAPVGVKLLFQFRQPTDRPNTNFKVWIVKHFGDVPPANLEMNNIASNIMLDSVDTEKCNPVLIKTFKAGNDFWRGDPTQSKEYTFHRKMWIKLPNSQYSYNGDNSRYGKRYNLAAYVGAYDTAGTLLTDIVGYVHMTSCFYFKDA